MFCQNTLYLKIQKVHDKTLRIVHESNFFYRDLLECNGSASIYQRHLQFLLTEIYKNTVTNNPGFMWRLFREREGPYSLRKGAVGFLPPAKSTTHGANSAYFRGTISSIKSSISIGMSKPI